MHYVAWVLVPNGGEAYEHVERLMAPYDENTDDNEPLAFQDEGEEGQSGHWDWWRVGGRWTGMLSGYDPKADPRNMEVCTLCTGTGMRNDRLGREARLRDPQYTCNGCAGKGTALKWPTEWVAHDADVSTTERALAKMTSGVGPFVLVTEEEWLPKERYTDGEFVEAADWAAAVVERLQRHEGRVVVVDYHS